MKQQIVVVGLGRFGTALAETLAQAGHEVLGIDADIGNVQRLADELSQAIQADATDQETLERLGLRDFDAGIVAIGENLEASILTTLNLRKLGLRNIIAKARTEQHGEILHRVGADRVVYPERDTGRRLALSGLAPFITDSLEVIRGFIVASLVTPPDRDGQTLAACGLHDDARVRVLLVARADRVELDPSAEYVLHSADIVVVAGNPRDVERVFAAR